MNYLIDLVVYVKVLEFIGFLKKIRKREDYLLYYIVIKLKRGMGFRVCVSF